MAVLGGAGLVAMTGPGVADTCGPGVRDWPVLYWGLGLCFGLFVGGPAGRWGCFIRGVGLTAGMGFASSNVIELLSTPHRTRAARGPLDEN